jgi:peptidoglycan/LPS O-acetylase OafA/YrhL
MLVLLFHGGFGFSGGFVGVDVFFVISGYLITGLILKQQQAGDFRLGAFWMRRIRRIVPAAAVMAFVTLLAGAVLLFPSDYERLAKSTVAHQLMAANVYFLQNTGYFEGPADLMPMLHTWSLAVEEQFYLLFPFALLWLGRLSRRRAGAVLAAVAVVSLAMSEWGARVHPGVAFYLLPFRAWELLLGGLLWYVPTGLARCRYAMQFVAILGTVAVFASAMLFDSGTRFPGMTALIPCAGAAAVIYANSQQLTIVGRVLALRPVVFVGLISYSLYLWHWPILAYSRYWLGEHLPGGVAAAALGVSVVCAWLSWRFVETPFRKSASGSRGRRAVLAAGGTIPALVAVSFGIILLGGVPERIPAQARRFRAAEHSKAFIREVELKQAHAKDFPTFGAERGHASCLIWGDSHAMALVPGLDAACKDYGVVGYQATHSTTPPLLDFVHIIAKCGLNERTPEFSREVVEFVADERVDVVFLNGVWSRYAMLATFEDRLESTVEELVAAGAEVVIVLDVARHKRLVPVALAQHAYWGYPTNAIGLPIEVHESRNRHCNSVIRRVAYGKAAVLDPGRYLTKDQLWRAELNSVALYRDHGHLSVEGGLRLRPMFGGVLRTLDSEADEPRIVRAIEKEKRS